MGTRSNDYEGVFTNPTGTQQTQNAAAAQPSSTGGNGVPFDAERAHNNLLKTIASDKKKIYEEIEELKKEIEDLKKLKKVVADGDSKLENKIAEIRKDLSEKVVIEKPVLFMATQLTNGEFFKAEKPEKEDEIKAATIKLLAAANSFEPGIAHSVFDMYFYKSSDGEVRDKPLGADELKKEGII